MAWNDPPSFDYQQISNTGKKFKHRYVLSDTNSKLGHQTSPMFQQTAHAPSGNNNQFQYQSPMAPFHHQGYSQQPFNTDNSQPTQLFGSTQPTYTNNHDNGTLTSTISNNSNAMATISAQPQEFNNVPYGNSDPLTSQNNNSINQQSMMYPNQPQQQFESAPPLPPPQQQSFQPQ